jgi:membrane-bound serine protease (ClpP class)
MNGRRPWIKPALGGLLLVLTLGGPFSARRLPAQPASGRGGALSPGSAWIIPIKGDIEPSLAAFARREARKALAAGAEYLIFEIDTFGGRVDSALHITSFISSIKNARTVAWVENGGDSLGVSWSAGAIIAVACADIYMARGTSMGAAAPVTLGAGGEMEATGEKTVAAVRSQMAALAERNGHPVGVALAMVDFDVELWEVLAEGESRILTLAELERLEREAAAQGTSVPERVQLISPRGKLLSLTAGEALRYGLARGLADSREDLLAQIGGRGDLVLSEPSPADGVISFLTSAPVQALLILAGLVLIFLEINTPGFGLPGVGAGLCFLVVFGSSALLGRVGSLEIIIFILGLALLAVEIFVLPGFGAAGISGLLLIGVSLVLSMQDFVIPRFDWEWDLLGRNAVVVCLGLIAAITGIAAIALLGPRLRLFDRLTLKTRITGTAGGPVSPEDSGLWPEELPPGEPALAGEMETDYRLLLGKTGVADTTLRPSGRVEIEGWVYPAETECSFVEAGRGVRVIRVRGNRIVVTLV